MNEKPYIGINGTGANNYKSFKYDTTTGMIVDYDGTLRDPVTGEANWKVDPNKFYGSGAAYNSSNPSSLSARSNASSATRNSTSSNTKNTTSATRNSISSNTKNSSSSTGSINSYATLLPSATVSKLNQFVAKIKAKRSNYSSDIEYNTFLDAFSIQLVELKTNQEFANNTTFQNMINYLIFEINQIRK